VLEHVGGIAGMEGVAVVHGSEQAGSGREDTRWSGQ
jgi:hypothetical protein